MCLRFGEKSPKKGIAFGIFSGLGFGLAYLTREDAMWLMPFAFCAAAVYVLFVIVQKNTAKQKLKLMIAPFAAVLVAAICICSYCYVNYVYYGRFIVSDFTSKESTAAFSAMVRADTDTPHRNLSVCRATRDKLAAAVPLMAQYCEYLDNGEYYFMFRYMNDDNEFGSDGYFWMYRKAAYDAGFATTPQQAKEFYQQLADDINAACDGGLVECRSSLGLSSFSPFVLPYDSSYAASVLEETYRSFQMLLLYEDFSSYPEISRAYEPAIGDWLAYTHQTSASNYIDAAYLQQTGEYRPAFLLPQRIVEFVYQIFVWIYRALIWFALAFAFMALGKYLKCGFKTKKLCFTPQFLYGILLLGIVMSFVMRIVLIAYIEATSFMIGTSLMYLASGGCILILFAALGIGQFLENQYTKA